LRLQLVLLRSHLRLIVGYAIHRRIVGLLERIIRAGLTEFSLRCIGSAKTEWTFLEEVSSGSDAAQEVLVLLTLQTAIDRRHLRSVHQVLLLQVLRAAKESSSLRCNVRARTVTRSALAKHRTTQPHRLRAST
jgi:hypothetical protein